MKQKLFLFKFHKNVKSVFLCDKRDKDPNKVAKIIKGKNLKISKRPKGYKNKKIKAIIKYFFSCPFTAYTYILISNPADTGKRPKQP